MFCPECTGLQAPGVVWSKKYSSSYKVANLLKNDNKDWFSPNEYIGHGFTLKLDSCRVNIAGIRLKNTCTTHCNRATRAFRIQGILRDGGPWVHLLAGELEKPEKAPAPAPTVQKLYFNETVEVQFLRFDLDSFWGVSGGLNFFQVIPVQGNLIVTEYL